jgi:RHS repeat-associated protein
VELLWQNANNSTQFTRYEVHKSTSQGFTPSENTLVANVTQMATTSYTVTGLSVRTTYYFQVVLVVTGGSLQSNEVEQKTGGNLGVKYLQDSAGTLTRVLYTDDGGSTWQTTDYQYDDVYALTKVTFPDSKTVSYFYDKAGQRTRMIDPASNVLTYLYDARGALTRVQVGDTAHGSYYYDDAGRRTRLLYGNSAYASYLYDDADRLTLLSNKKSDATVVSSFAYSVDKTGNRTKLALSNGDYAEYLYDQTYQLTREHRKDSQNATLYYNNFRYDAAGNRTRLEYNDGTSTTTTSYLYNTADQLTRETTGATVTTYLYDANGSLTKKDDGTNVHAYKYDFRNLMTDYDGPGTGNDTTYAYDAEARRVTKNVNGSKTAYVYDFLDVVADYNGSNQLQATYVTPALDENLTVTRSGSTYCYLQDALGSVRQLLDADETTENSYDYEAFGKTYGSPTENVTNRYRFTGREWDGETGLQYNRARWYAPTLGRWTSRDPLGQAAGTHVYGYVWNKPGSFADPSGQDGCKPSAIPPTPRGPWRLDGAVPVQKLNAPFSPCQGASSLGVICRYTRPVNRYWDCCCSNRVAKIQFVVTKPDWEYYAAKPLNFIGIVKRNTLPVPTFLPGMPTFPIGFPWWITPQMERQAMAFCWEIELHGSQSDMPPPANASGYDGDPAVPPPPKCSDYGW